MKIIMIQKQRVSLVVLIKSWVVSNEIKPMTPPPLPLPTIKASNLQSFHLHSEF